MKGTSAKCPKCGKEYAINRSLGRVRNHKPCFNSESVATQNKDAKFRVVPALPPANNYSTLIHRLEAERIDSERKQQEDEYLRNAAFNDRILNELAEAHRLKCLEEERVKVEQAAIDEANAMIKAEKERERQEQERRRNAPMELADHMMNTEFVNDVNIQISYVNYLGHFQVLERHRNDIKICNTKRMEKMAQPTVYDELRDNIWPALYRLSAEQSEVIETIHKLSLCSTKTKFKSAISTRIRVRKNQLSELRRKIALLGARQKELVWVNVK
tara:strand:- start:3521 stop:4336 length:816 start_codon:yes stop_codon:yes gene_type:complete